MDLRLVNSECSIIEVDEWFKPTPNNLSTFSLSAKPVFGSHRIEGSRAVVYFRITNNEYRISNDECEILN